MSVVLTSSAKAPQTLEQIFARGPLYAASALLGAFLNPPDASAQTFEIMNKLLVDGSSTFKGATLFVATSAPTVYAGNGTIYYDSTANALEGSNNGGAFAPLTLQGNTFNGANELVKLNGSTQLPAVNGNLVTNLNWGNLTNTLSACTGGDFVTEVTASTLGCTPPPSSVGTATNLAGGAANEVPYQTGAGATTFTAAPGADMVLFANSGAPTWTNTPTFAGTNLTGTAASLTAGHVTTDADLTGPITSVGNATSVAAQTGTGSTFVMNASPTLTGSVTMPGTGIWNSSGNVGIGTTGPTATLDVQGSFQRNVVTQETVSRSLNEGAVGNYVNIGYFSQTTSGVYARFVLTGTVANTVQSVEFEFHDTDYPAQTGWIQLPLKSGMGFGSTGDFAVDVKDDGLHTSTSITARIRVTTANASQTLPLTIQIEHNTAFTPDSTSGSGATVVSGYLAQREFEFPVSTSRWNNSTNGLFIVGDGSVGIGTTAPNAGAGNLTVAGTTFFGTGSTYQVTSGGAATLAGDVCTTAAGGLVPCNGNNHGTIGTSTPDAWASVYAYDIYGNMHPGAPDLAERYPGDVQAGDVVVLSREPEKNATVLDQSSVGPHDSPAGGNIPVAVEKSNEPYQSDIFGVVSTAPGIELSDPKDQSNPPIALTGRVPVKVDLEGGPIKIGDYLTSSSRPGYAMKATKVGATVGIALENFGTDETEGNGKTGKILCFVHVGGNQEAYVKDIANLQKQNRDILKQNTALRENLESLKSLVCGDHPGAAACR